MMSFLLRIWGGKAKAHIWDGGDTLCRMASTGGLVRGRYRVQPSTGGHAICQMCARAQMKQEAVGEHEGTKC